MTRKGVPLVEAAFQRLRQDIQDGRLQPGTRVVEQEVAERLAMSRTPVREALRRLEEVGLIMQAPHRGLVVGWLDPQSVNELYEMREGLEGTAAEMAARHASAAERQVMQQPGRARGGLAGPAERPGRAQSDPARDDLPPSHNRYLLRTLGGLRNAMALLGPTTFSAAGATQPLRTAQHGAIIGAICAGDAAAAGEAARAHIRSAHVVRVGMLADRLIDAATEPEPCMVVHPKAG